MRMKASWPYTIGTGEMDSVLYYGKTPFKIEIQMNKNKNKK